MAALFTINKNLRKPDYFDGVIQTVKYKTPLLTMLKRGKKPVDWAEEVEMDYVPTPGNLAAAEGSDFAEAGITARTTKVLKHQLQLFRSTKGWQVTEEALEMPSHNERGANAAAAHQQLLDAQEVTLSIENTIGSMQEAVERGSSTGTVPKTRGLMCWLSKLDDTYTTPELLHPVQTVDASFIPTAGIVGDITDATVFNQDLFRAELGKAMIAGGDADLALVGLVGYKLKQLMSDWTFKATAVSGVEVLLRSSRDADSKRAQFICDEFAFDGVTVRTVTDNHLMCNTSTFAPQTASYLSGAFICPDRWSIDTLVPLTNHDLPNRGGGPRGFHKAAMRLACHNLMSQFAIKYSV